MQNSREPKAGEVWLIDFDPRVGREQGGIRPALVISNDDFNAIRNDLHVVVPITTRDRGLPYHLKIAPPEGGLATASLIMCEQVRSQSIDRFLKRRGVASPDLLKHVQEMVGRFIDR